MATARLVADRAVLDQQALRHVEELGLGVVACSRRRRPAKNLHAPQVSREGVGEQAAGRGLGDGECAFLRAQQVGAHPGERMVAVADEILAEEGGAFRRDRLQLLVAQLPEGELTRQSTGAGVRAERRRSRPRRAWRRSAAAASRASDSPTPAVRIWT
jgi:hypothetical protein